MLNKQLGEFIPALGPIYRVAQNAKWRGSPFMPVACEHAAQVFKQKGYNKRVQLFDDNILIQEYPTGKVLFLFQLDVQGRTYHTYYEFDFTPDQLRHLKAAGIWEDFETYGLIGAH